MTDDAQLDDLGLLAEPTRRALYFYVANRREPVGRDEAADALGLTRGLAVFHLDKLAAEGLLDVEFRRPGGRGGPGSGRPAKLYRRSARQLDVTLPPRRYALAAELLAAAVDDPAAGAARLALDRVAAVRGRELGVRAAASLRRNAGAARRREALAALLAEHGYEPYADGAALRVRNCPFHVLAESHADLVCGMNRGFVGAAAAALGVEDPVRLDRRPGECCVVVGPDL